MTNAEQMTNNNEKVENLSQSLKGSGIDVSMWGKGNAKTVAHLLQEIEAGESEVIFSPEGSVARRVRVAWVDVLHFDGYGNVYQLYEDRQEYKDGRTRQRELSSSLGEKFKADEQPFDAASRALCEEIGSTAFQSLHPIGSQSTTYTPDSYPGLESQYETYSFVAVINSEEFNPYGYVEAQEDKSNYYCWKQIRPGK